jgi:hypothetical protein
LDRRPEGKKEGAQAALFSPLMHLLIILSVTVHHELRSKRTFRKRNRMRFVSARSLYAKPA